MTPYPFPPTPGTALPDGKDVPKEMIHPFGIVTKDEVKDYADVADEAICCPTFDRDWVRENLYK